jgi:anti-anti-sigma factor
MSWRAAAEVAVVRVAGEVDLLTVQVFRETVDQVLDQPPLVLVIDLSAVTFFGAGGLTVLVVARELVQQRGAALRLVCGARAVTRPLALVGLDHSFETYNDLENRAVRRRLAWLNRVRSGHVTNRGADRVGTVVHQPRDAPERVEHFLIGAVLLGAPDELLLSRGIVHPAQELLQLFAASLCSVRLVRAGGVTAPDQPDDQATMTTLSSRPPTFSPVGA